MKKDTAPIKLTDTIKGSVAIRRVKPSAWEIKQRVLAGPRQDNAQNPVWIRIDNPGPRRNIRISIFWADTQWPHFRLYGYQKIGSQYTARPGRTESAYTAHRLEIPPGVSYFGGFPWYSNEDAEGLLAGLAGHPDCRVRLIGKTAQGRKIKCLTIGQAGNRRRKNVVIMARTHANESSGSFAVEGIVKYLLNDAEARKLLKQYVFHLFPNVNPDGIAAGIKLTRIAPHQYNEFNMFVSGMSSNDPTMKALRVEILKLKPACLIDNHSYLPGFPMAGFLEKRVGAALYDQLFDGTDPDGNRCYMTLWPKLHAGTSIVDHCHKRFKTTIILTEFPWNFARLPADIEKLGVIYFRAAIAAHANGRTS